MQPIHRSQLIEDLSHTALGLIAEAELSEPEKARSLVELAGVLDRLRVSLLSEVRAKPELASALQDRLRSFH